MTETDLSDADDVISDDEQPDDEQPDDAVLDEPSKRIRIAATAIVIVPFVTAVLRAMRSDWFPVGDNALLFIRTRDVLTEDHPFLGSWTSASLSVGENMNNPGALYDWLVAPFAHLLPPGPAAAIGVALINVAMVCVISAAAHRVGGWAFQRWALLATALMAWSMGSELLIDIWQANALIFAFIAVLIIGVGIAAGDDGLLPWAAFITTLLLQTHISYAYIFVFLVLGVVGVRIWQRNEIDSSGWRRPVGVSAGIIAVLWAPSLWEQFFGTGKGNMSRLLGNSSGGDFSLGLDNAAQIVASLGVRPPFWGRSGYSTTVVVTKITETAEGRTLDVPGVLPLWAAALGLTVLVAMLAGLAWLAHAGRRRAETAAGILAIVVLIGSVLALSRLTIGSVGLSPHHVRWAWPLMAFVHLVIVWLAVSAWQARRRADGIRPARRSRHRRRGGCVDRRRVAAEHPVPRPTVRSDRRVPDPAHDEPHRTPARPARRFCAGALRHLDVADLRAVQLDDDDVAPGTGHRVPRRRRGHDSPARRGPPRRRHRAHADLPARRGRRPHVRRARMSPRRGEPAHRRGRCSRSSS